MLQSFDLELAKKGAKVTTRNKKPARIVCFDRVDKKMHGQLVVLLLNSDKTWEMPVYYTLNGNNVGSHDPQLDLFIDDGK